MLGVILPYFIEFKMPSIIRHAIILCSTKKKECCQLTVRYKMALIVKPVWISEMLTYKEKNTHLRIDGRNIAFHFPLPR